MTKGWRKGVMTERQRFIVDLRKQGKKLDEIGILYQQRFGTKQKLSRERIRSILAYFGLQ